MIELTLPIPPSANKIWRPTRDGRLIRTPAYRAWMREAGWEAKRQMIGTVSFDRNRVVVLLYVPHDHKRDLDNFLKPTLDLLESVGIFHNDRQVERLHLMRRDQEGITVQVEKAK